MLFSLATLFWICLVVGLYPYVGYPLCIALLKAIRPRPIRRAAVTPSVTVVISAYNEASHIAATVRNKLAQDYPEAMLDVMVVSDGSTDGTDDVLRQLAGQELRVSCLRQEPRTGKTAALNAVVALARGELIVFADANSMYRADTVRRLVEVFADPEVGYASGRMLYVDPRGSLVGDGCTAYMRYENALRRYESAVGSMVGADGAVDAIRCALYRPMRSDQLPDFVLPLSVVEQGYRVVYVPQAVLEEETLTNESAEYRMRVRVALRALWAIWDKRTLLNPLRYPLFSWQLASHKLLRYLSFAPLAVAAICSWLLVPEGWPYLAVTSGQGLAAVLALAATLGPKRLRAFPVTRYCYYFVLLNWASAVAFGRFIRGDKQAVWQPRTG
jgi:cellulose synthase/poly-beta-1,6-N-acetylglucosamine synthase-like glycosyltransferase